MRRCGYDAIGDCWRHYTHNATCAWHSLVVNLPYVSPQLLHLVLGR